MAEIEHVDEDKARRRKETEAQKKKRLAVAVSEVLASESGRTVLGEFLKLCQLENINAFEGAASGRVEGARAVGLMATRILRDNDPQGFMKLYREMYL